MLILIQSTSLVSHLIHGLHRSANMTAGFIAGLFIIHFLIRAGKINAAKIAAIAVINANTVLMAIFFGAHTNLIDFLLLTALLPLYFFEAQNRKLIFWSVALSIVPFALYHYMAPYFAQYELPMGQQMAMFNTTNWVKVLSLAALVFLIYHKNALYEKEVQEKEAQLIGQKKLYECMLDQIPIDIVTFDKQLKYSYINSTAIKDPQIRSWLIGKTNVDYFKERNLDMKVAAERDRILHEALSQEQTVEFEETFVDRHGSLRHSIKGTSPIYSENKELLCLIAYSLDITDIKEAERKLKEYAVELERKNEDLHHFVNATSHDLKTPLRNITSYLQLLEKRNTGKLDGESLSMIAHTIKSVKHLNQLIKDIYHYSIADRNEKPAEITNLQEVLDTVLAEMKNTITEKSVTVQHAQFPVIKASASHMGMVFSNLLSNAIKYNNTANPYIFINAQANDDEYVISVSDNGIGIPVEYNKKIFEIFQRLHTSNEYEGTGVGLAICSKIVENYGGRMWVESEPGKGSVFYFSLAKAIVSPESPGRHKILSYKNFAIAG
ncbi:MAG TPA: ATP-binding protein [Chitinophagales bacterium]|nr:ATP-binding protein [Chitinophagales bacterium]